MFTALPPGDGKVININDWWSTAKDPAAEPQGTWVILGLSD